MLWIVSAVSFAQADRPGYDAFVGAVRAQVVKLGLGAIDDHMNQGYFIVLRDSPYAEKGSRIGLSNLFDLCAQEDAARWPAIIAGFFTQLKKKTEEQERVRPLLSTYQTAMPLLRVRVYPSDQPQNAHEGSVVDHTFPGVVGVVVVSYPSGAVDLEASYLSRWHVDGPRVFSDALKNTLVENKETFGEYDFRAGLKVSLLSSETDPFVTTGIYDLADRGMPAGPFGALVGAPNRVTLVAMALPAKELVRSTIVELMGLMSYLYDQGPESISKDVYWYYDGGLSVIQKDKATGVLVLPEKLAGMLR